MRVLVIDDDADLAGDLMAVKPARVDLMAAAGADAAIAMLKEHDFDAVLLDLRMPASLASADANEGLALLGMITGGSRGRIPVVVATDSDDPELMMWCGRLGAERVVSKSRGPGAIMQAVAGLARGDDAHGLGSQDCGDSNGVQGRHHAAS